MNARVMRGAARGVIWGLQRNPLYLFSAISMAYGARLYLVDPMTYAGDVSVILLTLAILQAYEWAILGVLLFLRRFARAPEDQGTLLLVAAFFWTGPLAATVELAAEETQLGAGLGTAVAILALLELWHVQRRLQLRLTVSGRLLAALCLALLVITPLNLRVVAEEGTDEVFLYCCWWIFAGITLLTVGTFREQRNFHEGSRAKQFSHPSIEILFLMIVIAASVTHLIGLNYAFVGHARFFYAAPLMMVLTWLLTDYMDLHRGRHTWLRLFIAGIPIVALIGARQGFDPAVPVGGIPLLLQKPFISILALAALIWWLSAWRLRSVLLFHLGSLAFAWLCWQTFPTLPTEPKLVDSIVPAVTSRGSLILALFGATAYLLSIAVIRRSRTEFVMALITLQPAVGLLIAHRSDAVFLSGTVLLWSALLGQQLHSRTRHWTGMLVSACLLLAWNWCFDFDADSRVDARLSTVVFVTALLVISYLHAVEFYQLIAGSVFVTNTLFIGGRLISSGPYPFATSVVVGSFLLLAIGAIVSWYKHVLLARAQSNLAPISEVAAGTEPANDETG